MLDFFKKHFSSLMLIGMVIISFGPYIEEYTGIPEEPSLFLGAIIMVCSIIGGIAPGNYKLIINGNKPQQVFNELDLNLTIIINKQKITLL